MKPFPVVLSTLGVAVMSAAPALAQSREPGIDVAVQATMLRLSEGNATSAGLGGRVTFNVVQWAAIDTEVSFSPSDDFNVALMIRPALTGRLVYHRQRTEGFLGIKVGHRRSRVGVFAKARPGFTRLGGEGVECIGEPCTLMLIFPPSYRTEFAFDLGGVLEFYPSARVVTRIDLGDVMIRHRSPAPPCSSCTTHNFTSRLGLGLRF